MVVSDRLLVALAKYLEDAVDWVGLGLSEAVVPRVRDWEGSKSSFNVTLDLDEPTEHEVIDGVYSATGQIAIEMKAREISESIRREVLEAIEASLTQPGVILPEVLEWLNNPENDRGLGTEALEVYDLRSDSGGWNVEDDWFRGEVGITAQFRGGLSLVDLSYYFFDASDFTSGAVNSWDGSVSGTNNLGLVATQTTSADQPISYGPLLAFADQSDHFDISATAQEGWQCVGTTRGCFAYKTNNNSISTLNLLGNEDPNGYYYRQTGGLFGIKLLPASSSTEQVEKVLRDFVNAGAEEKPSGSLQSFFYLRKDIVEFFPVDMSDCDSFFETWRENRALVNFPENAKLGTNGPTAPFNAAFYNCVALRSFSTPLPTAGNCNFIFGNCYALESFNSELPSATNLSYAWRFCRSLVDFTTIDMSNCSNFAYTWQNCESLESIDSNAKLGTNVTPSFVGAFYNCFSLMSFSTPMATSSRFGNAWKNCSSLVNFSENVLKDWNPQFIATGVFFDSWAGCSSLSSESVRNIVVSLVTSGKSATEHGESGGTPLSNPEITIDYDGTQLSQEATDAIATLSARGWSVNLNGVIQ